MSFTSYLFILLLTTLLYYNTHSIIVVDNHLIITTSSPLPPPLPLPPQQEQQLLNQWILQQQETSYQTILLNINPSGTKRGFFAASLSTSHPDYFYTWTRDSALVARVLSSLSFSNDSLLLDYIDFQIDTQTTFTPCNCLGEPKFQEDGSSFMQEWGRPQNDGPAERVSTFINIASRWLNNGYKDKAWIQQVMVPAIIKDLDYIVQVWYQPSFDLWEEVKGTHFYTLMVMRKALLDAIDFLPSLYYQEGQQYQKIYNSNNNLEQYKLTAYLMEKRIETFWSSQFNYIMTTQHIENKDGVQKPSGLDVSTILAANLVASKNDGFFSPSSDKILATAVALQDSFTSLYPINNQQQSLGTCIGRYPEDIYDGYGTSVGNPWFLATAAYTELYYLAIQDWKRIGISINQINRPFFHNLIFDEIQDGHYEPNSNLVQQVIKRTKEEADRFLKIIQYHQAKNGSMSEQFDRFIGYMAGARDLTWSHAAFISAVKAREGEKLP